MKLEIITDRPTVFTFTQNWEAQTGNYFLRKFPSTKPQCYCEAGKLRHGSIKIDYPEEKKYPLQNDDGYYIHFLLRTGSTHRGQCISSFAIEPNLKGHLIFFFYKFWHPLTSSFFFSPSQTEQSAEAVTFPTLIRQMRDRNIAFGSDRPYSDSTWVSTVSLST
jgi:hypothetical protein